jgi:hypothetical protein
MTHAADVPTELARLIARFFECVSFEQGGAPAYGGIRDLFIDSGLLIKNSGTAPDVCSLQQFIESRQASVDAGDLTRFREAELASDSLVFGGVAQRCSGYVKSGVLKGAPFEARGLVFTQFIRTPSGWRMNSMVWDDEREGLRIPARFG